jgi:hypothetical protein
MGSYKAITAMSTYIFELEGVTPANMAQVEAALNAIPGIKATVRRTAKGKYVVFVETTLTKDEAYNAVAQALAFLGITVKKTAPPDLDDDLGPAPAPTPTPTPTKRLKP